RQRQATAALSEFQQALGIQQRLADEYPYVPRFQENLAASYRTLGRSLFASGQLTSAEDAYSKCLALIERRLEGYPEQIEYRHMLAEALIELGRCRDRSHQHEAAETAARRALIALNPGDPADRNLSAQAHYRIARALFARGIDSDAVEHFESSIV